MYLKHIMPHVQRGVTRCPVTPKQHAGSDAIGSEHCCYRTFDLNKDVDLT